MVSTVTTLTTMAQALLDVCETALATTTAGAPLDVYLDVNAPAWDCCPALVVVVPNLTEEVTSPLAPAAEPALRSTLGRINLATYVVFALRCAAVPDNSGNPPSSARKQEVAVTVQQDMWALWNGVNHAIQDGTIFDTCTGVHFDGVRPINSQGGCVGCTFQLRAMIEGIPNT